MKIKIIKKSKLDEKEGVPHYTKDGKEWKGKTHKMPDGTLMSGNPHDVEGSGENGESEVLYHLEDLDEKKKRKKRKKRKKKRTPRAAYWWGYGGNYGDHGDAGGDGGGGDGKRDDEFEEGKKDACYHKVKSRYKVWPSAYASGALVKCRKVGAKNWGNSKKNEEKKKAGSESSKESNLGDWFGRKGAKGKKSGWVDCNAPDGKGGYKACGRESGEKRSKYPACRPTPSACKEKGKGKSWGKKGAKKNETLDRMIDEEIRSVIFEKGLLEHVKTETPLHENIYRVGSTCYFNTIRQGREFYKIGLYEAVNEEERDMLENTNLGEWVVFEGQEVPLDFPMYIETIDEKKDPPIGKPMKNSGGGKKYQVYVRNPKTGNIKKITYGDSKGGLKGNWNDPEARKSFAARHNCKDKKDRTKAGYWACRAHKDFGKNVPGRFW
tara:strand:- start:1493 stop:2800 length:1308 start_codon:yes stop_codon:yes gene_type:complete